eukprot:9480664-Pyramimonas_sp.AAC.1
MMLTNVDQSHVPKASLTNQNDVAKEAVVASRTFVNPRGKKQKTVTCAGLTTTGLHGRSRCQKPKESGRRQVERMEGGHARGAKQKRGSCTSLTVSVSGAPGARHAG